MCKLRTSILDTASLRARQEEARSQQTSKCSQSQRARMTAPPECNTACFKNDMRCDYIDDSTAMLRLEIGLLMVTILSIVLKSAYSNNITP